ncbi:glycosyltransferase [Lacipirellula sp.]|uniref:glycosyltransferase n=1 Tax=Lacipirellula sp. TaxID=2691419 RepID=UPI003D0E8340
MFQNSSKALAVTATSTSNGISLVLPAWNEAESIERAVSEAEAALAIVSDCFEIIVVDDGSSDETAVRVTAMAATRPSVRLIRHEANRGYGAALRSGFEAANFELVAFTDADCQFNLTELDRFVLLSRDYEIVCGYRIDRKDSPLRCLYSRVYNQLVRLLLDTGVRDVDCALKMFRRETLNECDITENGFLVNAEIISQARRQGRSIVEVGVSHRPREAGASTVSIAHIPVVLASLVRHWWNKVQFSAADGQSAVEAKLSPEKAANDRRFRFAEFILILVAAILLLSNLNYPLIDRDETRYGEIPREMIESGDWTLPTLNFRPYYDKPVLLYWLCATSYSIFGVSPGAARIIPAICGLATLLATVWFGNRVLGRRAGFFAGLALFLSVGFLGGSRILLLDGLLTCFTTISFVAAYEAVKSDKLNWKWWTITALAAGLGFLCKGPISVVLLAPPLVMHCWLTKNPARLLVRHWAYLFAIVVLVNAPWFYAVSQRDPAFISEFFYRHNLQRFAGAFHAEPFWYFVPILLVAGHPWTFMAIPYASFLWSKKEPIRKLRSRSLSFPVLWSAWCFAFFSMSSCKLPTYILPAAPAFALMIGHYLDRAVFASIGGFGADFSRRWSPWLASMATCLAGIGFTIFMLMSGLESWTAGAAISGLWILLAAGAALSMRRWPTPAFQWSVCVSVTLILSAVVLHRNIPRFALAETVFGSGSPVALDVRGTIPMATIGHEWSSVPFDLDRNDVQHFEANCMSDLIEYAGQHEQAILVLKTDQQVEYLRKSLPPGKHLIKVADRGPAKVVLAVMKAPGEALIGAKPVADVKNIR